LQRPNDHLSGYGCKKCQYEKTSKENKFTNEIFIEKAKQIHNNKYDYSLVKYNGYENKVIIICSKHGKFEQTPHNHLRDAGCPSCFESRGEKKVAEILLRYNIKFEREKTFPDLKDKSNLFYDFYLPEHKVFIEYNGKQHCEPIDFFGGKKSHIETRKHDIIKLKYAINNKYLLISLNNIPIKNMDETLVNALKYKSII
jgi:very-short-patch-repair endonuclease